MYASLSFAHFQDLEYLSEGLEGRSFNPVALLFDQLLRPNADLGKYQGSCLKWHYGSRAVKHLVLGSGPPGGCWHNMQGSQLTLSLNNWLELPGSDFQDWLRAHRSSTVRKPCNLVTNGVKSDGYNYDRATTSHIAEYYKDFVTNTNIVSNFWNDAKVLSVKRMTQADCTDCRCRVSYTGRDGCWEIRGVRCATYASIPELFVVHAYNVVLATGNRIPKTLGIPGENLPFVYHKMDVIDRYLNELPDPPLSMDPCLVIGAGLSAADCVLALRNKGVPVIHVIRRHANDAKIIYNQLPGVVYPEYYKVGKMIKGEVTTAYGKDAMYTVYTRTSLVEIRQDKECILKRADGNLFKQKVSNVFVLIGARPDLSFVHGVKALGVNPVKPVDSKENPIDVNPFTYESVKEPGLFAVGPLIGDNFVRFGIGGALGVASHLMREDE